MFIVNGLYLLEFDTCPNYLLPMVSLNQEALGVFT